MIVPYESSREDVVQHLKVERERVIVIPLACEDRFRPTSDPQGLERVKRRYNLPDRYLLFTGHPRTEEKRDDTAEGLLLPPQRHDKPGPQTGVIAGGKGWGCEEPFGTVKTLGLDDMRDWREALKEYLIDRGTTLKAV